MIKETDVIIIGAGIIGAAIGYYLTEKGKDVVVLEKHELAAGATGACDQFVVMQSKIPGIHFEIALQSAYLYKKLARDLDLDIEYNACGGMIVIENAAELKIMEERVKKQCEGGLKVEILNAREAKKKQPQLSDKVIAAAYSPHDAHVSSLKVTEAFLKKIVEKGGRVYNYTDVIGVMLQDEEVKGVYTSRGEIRGNYIINAAGIHSPAIGRMIGLDIPVKPRRGQLVVTEPVATFAEQVTLSTKYLAAKHNPEILEDVEPRVKELGIGLAMEQTKKGNLLFGSTREFAGYDTGVTREGIIGIIKNAVNLYPRLKDLHIIRCFSGLRPATPDGLPILGNVDKLNGFIIATGHEGDGICLAPITGKLICQHICGEKTDFDLSNFSLNRFAN